MKLSGFYRKLRKKKSLGISTNPIQTLSVIDNLKFQVLF